MAHLVVGERERAEQLFSWAQSLREPDGAYWTGIVYPEEVHFPGQEQSTYTAAAVVLAADALAGSSPASGLFIDHDSLPTLISDPSDAMSDPRGDRRRTDARTTTIRRPIDLGDPLSGSRRVAGTGDRWSALVCRGGRSRRSTGVGACKPVDSGNNRDHHSVRRRFGNASSPHHPAATEQRRGTEIRHRPRRLGSVRSAGWDARRAGGCRPPDSSRFPT